MRGAALIAAAALLLGAPGAQAQSPPSILGAWVFEAPLEPADGCVISGHARITAERADAYAVRISAREVCPQAGTWISEQQCAARRNADKLSIDCELIRAEPSNYADDDFVLQIRNGELMDGWLISLRRGPAIWRRPGPQRIS